MMNPNNSTADIYDIVSAPLKGTSVTDAEISLINFLVEPNSNILDIGGGTGRHAIILAEQGHYVTVIDSSEKMLNHLKFKIDNLNPSIFHKVTTVSDSIYNHKLKAKTYKLAIMMWNTFNEVALTKNDALKLLKKIYLALQPGAKVLINIDDAGKIDPSKFDFKTEFIRNSNKYMLHWTIERFNKRTNTATSKEETTITDIDSNVLKKTEAFITQRYWHYDEIGHLAKKAGFKIQRTELSVSNELYIILSK